MFAFIADLLKNQFHKPPPEKPLAAHSKQHFPCGITQYEPDLVDSLEKEHSDLMRHYNAMWNEGFKKRDYHQLVRSIELFKTDFQSHILKENVKLFVYLEQNLSDNLPALKLVKSYRQDINEIATTIIPFCKKYGSNQHTLEMEQEFERDYSIIGNVLERRIESEERELYILYRNN